MKIASSFVAVALVIALTSCGGGGPPPEKTKTKDSESKKTESAAPAASKTSESAKTAEAPKTSEPAKTGDAAKTGAAAPVPTPTDTSVKVVLPKDFKDEDIAGKRISAWLMDLNSDNKSTLVEALNACELIGKGAKPGLARIESLTKNPDKEIAEAATAALAKVK